MANPYDALPANWDAVGLALRTRNLRETHALLEETVRHLANRVVQGKIRVQHNGNERTLYADPSQLAELYDAGMRGIDASFKNYRSTISPARFVVQAVLSGIERHLGSETSPLPLPDTTSVQERNTSDPFALWYEDPLLQYFLKLLEGHSPRELAEITHKDLGYRTPLGAYRHFEMGLPGLLRRARRGRTYERDRQNLQRDVTTCLDALDVTDEQRREALNLLDAALASPKR